MIETSSVAWGARQGKVHSVETARKSEFHSFSCESTLCEMRLRMKSAASRNRISFFLLFDWPTNILELVASHNKEKRPLSVKLVPASKFLNISLFSLIWRAQLLRFQRHSLRYGPTANPLWGHYVWLGPYQENERKVWMNRRLAQPRNFVPAYPRLRFPSPFYALTRCTLPGSWSLIKDKRL